MKGAELVPQGAQNNVFGAKVIQKTGLGHPRKITGCNIERLWLCWFTNKAQMCENGSERRRNGPPGCLN